jgi:hypothetical protein
LNCGDGYDAYERANQATDEIWDLVEPTALLPGRCAPTEEEIARRLHRADCDCPEPGAEDHGIDYAMLAEDVLALFAAQPTVHEAKAEGWAEGLNAWLEWSNDDFRDALPSNPYRSEADHS